MDMATIKKWFRPDRPRLLSDDQVIESFHMFGPRCNFLKTLPAHAAILDVGAGDGSLNIFRQWPQPQRTDLRIYAYAGDKGSGFEQYDGFETGWWPSQPPRFEGVKFSAIMACNFIEHIDDPIDFVRAMAEKLPAGGSLFLEWPRPESASLPTSEELARNGINIMTGNYFDDLTHRPEIPAVKDVCAALESAGMTIERSGIVRVPFVDEELASIAQERGDVVLATLAYWSLTGWCQYVVARRAG